MHPHVATLGISALMVLAGTALTCFGDPHAAAAAATPENEHHTSLPGEHAGAHPWSGGTGTIPDNAAAATELERRSRIVIENDAAFNPANGVRSGRGTLDDPFVISGWYVDQILISDTRAAYEIKENYVSDILILDWTGQGGYVHHNHIANLRTNRNVERIGDPSATVIENNRILEVEELRHFDGIVRNNTIGQQPLLDLVDLGPSIVLNIAGLNGAGIHDNLILGGVDMKIHGHHHSDATGAHSHNHGKADTAQNEGHVEDHQRRYVDFLFYNNTIRDRGFGLRYNDLAHAGDDRTATSEEEPDLEKPHVHHTRVALVNNVIEGATLRIAIVNSPDERHLPGQTGELIIRDNRIVKPMAGDGLVVADIHDTKVLIEGNRVEKGDLQLTSAKSAILLSRAVNSTITVRDNWLAAYEYGIRATQFDKNTTWVVEQNDDTGSSYPIYWDASVPNAPEGAEGEAHAHDHGEGPDAAAPALLRRLTPHAKV